MHCERSTRSRPWPQAAEQDSDDAAGNPPLSTPSHRRIAPVPSARMLRHIDPVRARLTASRLEALERELSLQMAAAANLLAVAGGDSGAAARVRVSTSWWTDQAASLRTRADAVETTGPVISGPAVSEPPGPKSAVHADLSRIRERRDFLASHLRLLNSFVAWLPGNPLASIRSGMARAIAAQDRAIADRTAWTDPSRRLLLFDPTGDGRIAEAIGDLENAEHIVVLVPGVGNDLTTYERTLHADALRLAERLTGTDTAVVTWLGYDPPDTITGALSRGPATEGANALGLFIAGLGPAHTTVIAHSYGSLVAGLAAKEGAIAPDELVFIGSPGVGANSVYDLDLPPSTTVWSGLTPLDPIRLARPDCMIPPARCSGDLIFGTDPHSPAFGTKTFAAGDPSVWSAHSSYYDSTSLDNLVHIVLGEDDEVTTDW